MAGESEMIDPLDDEDLWIRGIVYVRFKRALRNAEMELVDLEDTVARARYEYEIVQRLRDRTTDPEAREEREIRANLAHDILEMAEQELAEVSGQVDYCRAMIAEIQNDLGEKADEYEVVLTAWGWDDEDDDVDYDECAECDDESCPLAGGAFLVDEDEWEDDETSDEEVAL